jgi:hypothetical protein
MKARDCIRLISVSALLAIGFFSVGCGGEEKASEYTLACNTTLRVAGYWHVAFKCENGECLAGTDTYLVSQGTSDLTTVSAEIVDSTLLGDIGTVFEGELCGSVFTFSATDPGNDEAGSWTFTDTSHMTKTTTYDGGTYTCTGYGTANPLPYPDPIVCLGP